jgi:hypothetical protein
MQNTALLIAKSNGTYIYRSALKGSALHNSARLHFSSHTMPECPLNIILQVCTKTYWANLISLCIILI